jgi:hypothetical protein
MIGHRGADRQPILADVSPMVGEGARFDQEKDRYDRGASRVASRLASRGAASRRFADP